MALRVWNYNKDWDGTFRGVRLAQIDLDGQPQLLPNGYSGSTTISIRKASGVPEVDGYQTIALCHRGDKQANNQRQPLASRPRLMLQQNMFAHHAYDAVNAAPVGFTLKLVLLSTWGDPHYIGLNG